MGDDFREGKITMPVLPAYHGGGPAERDVLGAHDRGQQPGAGRPRPRLKLIGATGAIRTTLDLASRFAEGAKQRLDMFPPSPLRDALADVADFTVSRAS